MKCNIYSIFDQCNKNKYLNNLIFEYNNRTIIYFNKIESTTILLTLLLPYQ